MKRLQCLIIGLFLLNSFSLLALPPTFIQVKIDRGISLLQQGKYKEVLEELIPLYKEEPSVEILQIIANASFELGEYERAAQLFNLLLEQSPRSQDTFFYLGLCMYQLGKSEEAKRALTQAVDLDIHTGEALYYLGMIAQRGGDYIKAVEFFSRSASEDPDLRTKATFRAAGVVYDASLKDTSLRQLAKAQFEEVKKISGKGEDEVVKAADGYLVAIKEAEDRDRPTLEWAAHGEVEYIGHNFPGYPGYPLLPLETVSPIEATYDVNGALGISVDLNRKWNIAYNFEHHMLPEDPTFDWQRHELSLFAWNSAGLQGQLSLSNRDDFGPFSQRVTGWGTFELKKIDESLTTLVIPASLFIVDENRLLRENMVGTGVMLHPSLSLLTKAYGHDLGTIFLGRAFLAQTKEDFVDGGGKLTYVSPEWRRFKLSAEAGSRYRHYFSSIRIKELDVWGEVSIGVRLIKSLNLGLSADWFRRYAEINTEQFDSSRVLVNLRFVPIQSDRALYARSHYPQ
ncbi:MAG TPA: tetratricopeptide repeat protein [Bdellovibrionota bacterium]|nr:tetratricopeptide repeat protein [Bdellovibrionota bacterium]